jgi:hypothetical protein
MSVLPRRGILYLRARSRVESALLLRNFGAIDSVSFHPGVNMRGDMAMSCVLAGGSPARVTASHRPDIKPCSHGGNGVIDA